MDDRVALPNYIEVNSGKQTTKLCGTSLRLQSVAPMSTSQPGSVLRPHPDVSAVNTNLPYRLTRHACCALAWFGLLSASVAVAAPFVAGDPSTASPTDRPARQWATDAAQNEARAIEQPGNYLRYRLHLVDRKGDQVRDEVESRDGTVARLILRDGRALTPDEDTAERGRLSDVLASPDDFAKHMRGDRSNKKLAVDLVRLMPDAMLYTYVPGQPQLGNTKSRHQIVLDYTPNSQWTPPTTTAEALTGLRGRIWIDVDSHTLVRMEGNIFRPVNFGWGMLAHIYPGGMLVLEQTNPGGGRWIFTHFEESLSVRALMVKTMEVHSRLETSDFQAIPDMSYTDAIHLLLNTPLPSH